MLREAEAFPPVRPSWRGIPDHPLDSQDSIGARPSLEEAAQMLQAAATASKRRRSMAVAGEVAPFVRTVYTLLRVCETDVIRWSEDGRRVIIANPSRFGAEICPKFFRHKNVLSFTRLLSMYQFRKISNPAQQRGGELAFEHPHFVRGREDLLHFVHRKGSREEAVEVDPETALEPIHASIVDPTRLDALEQQLDELRAENKRLKDLEKERDKLQAELQQQKEVVSALLDVHMLGGATLPDQADQGAGPNFLAHIVMQSMCAAIMDQPDDAAHQAHVDTHPVPVASPPLGLATKDDATAQPACALQKVLDNYKALDNYLLPPSKRARLGVA